MTASVEHPPITRATAGSRTEAPRPGFASLLFGVLVPLFTLGFELATGGSAALLFDPVPTWFHVALVALVPGANLLLWRAARRRDARHAGPLGWLNGIAAGVCIFFCILYLPALPIVPLGVLGLSGLGLLPLTPCFALAATLSLRVTYRRRIGHERLPGAWAGMTAGLGISLILQIPAACTHYGLALAAGDPKTRARGVRMLRAVGDDELLLEECYGVRAGLGVDLVRTLVSGEWTVSSQRAREVYYRATGRAFNSVPRPSLIGQIGRWGLLGSWLDWDEALGGDEVAGRVQGLSLRGSRMDAVAEPDASLVYCEWTLEFENVAGRPREARAQIALPPGAVVSRLTLWIDGEEREAAFAARSRVRGAYQSVAVAEERDPVLVTTCGPDRVLLQCFPVPPDGGRMKTRIGITAPLVLESPERGRFVWPRLSERNFHVGADLRHARSIESPLPMAGAARTAAGGHALREAAAEAGLSDVPAHVVVQRSADATEVHAAAPEPGRFIRQTIVAGQAAAPARVVFVVDGSLGMRPFAGGIADALAELPAGLEVAVLLCGDEVMLLGDPEPATGRVVERLQSRIRGAGFAGGQDNVPGLEQGWDLAADSPHGVVVWIHGPQPVLLASPAALQRRCERSASPVVLYELQAGAGPDRIVEELDGMGLEPVPRLGTLREDAARLIRRLAGEPYLKLVREQVDESGGRAASRHVARLWARDEALRLDARAQRAAAVRLAASQQLVTPVTGAVVLETSAQYARHDLRPADPETVPVVAAVPEPGTWALVGLGIALVAFRRIRRTRAAAHSPSADARSPSSDA